MKTKNILISSLTLMIAAYTGLTLAETFQGPVDIPENYNASAPINVSTTGQYKEGWFKLISGLIVGTEDNPTIYAYGAVGGSYDNKVGIGTDSPWTKLTINDNQKRIFTETYVDSDSSKNVVLQHYFFPVGDSRFANGNGGVQISTYTNHALGFTTNNKNGADLFINTNGNVGIGTDSPGAKLDIKSTVSGPGGWHKAINFSDSSHAALTLPAGNLLFGLHSNGNFYWAKTKNNGADFKQYNMYLESDGDLWVRGDVTANSFQYSDKRLKKDIQKLENYRDILKIDAVRFNWKKDGKADIGIIAQEVQKYFPEFVRKGSDGYLTVSYAKLAVPMLNLLQEQEKRLDKQEKEIQKLKKLVEELRR